MRVGARSKSLRREAYNGVMLKDPAELLRDALPLPTEARSALIDSLLESLDVQVDDDAEAAWQQEIYSRLQEIDSGAVRLVRWADARRRLWARLQQ